MSEQGSWLLALLAAPLALAALGATGLSRAAAQDALAGSNRLPAPEELQERLRRRLAEGLALSDPSAGSLSVASARGLVGWGVAKVPAAPGADTRRLAGANALARAQALQATLTAERPLAAITGHWHGAAVAQANADLQSARELLSRGHGERAAGLAQAAERRLALAMHDGAERLAAGQREAVTGALGSALSGLGYQVTAARGRHAAALWATRGDQTVAVALAGAGTVTLDLAGHSGLSCTTEVQRIEAALREQGVAVQRASVVTHGQREGGTLIQAAARQARQQAIPPEQALLATVEPAGASGAGVARRREPAGQGENEERRLQRARAYLGLQRQAMGA